MGSEVRGYIAGFGMVPDGSGAFGVGGGMVPHGSGFFRTVLSATFCCWGYPLQLIFVSFFCAAVDFRHRIFLQENACQEVAVPSIIEQDACMRQCVKRVGRSIRIGMMVYNILQQYARHCPTI